MQAQRHSLLRARSARLKREGRWLPTTWALLWPLAPSGNVRPVLAPGQRPVPFKVWAYLTPEFWHFGIVCHIFPFGQFLFSFCSGHVVDSVIFPLLQVFLGLYRVLKTGVLNVILKIPEWALELNFFGRKASMLLLQCSSKEKDLGESSLASI